jgi:hypothetical protein
MSIKNKNVFNKRNLSPSVQLRSSQVWNPGAEGHYGDIMVRA